MAGLASRQFGVVARRQLLRLGISDGEISWWLRSGYLHGRLPGVYSVGYEAFGVEGRLTAALLWAGPGAMLSHGTGAWWLGLTGRQPAAIHLSTPRQCRLDGTIVVHDRCRLTREWRRQLPVAPVPEILRQLAATGGRRTVRRALAEAEYRGWLDLDELQRVCGRGRPGSAALRAALARHMPQLAHTRSELERALLELCEAHGVPLPELNVQVGGVTVDALWREQRVVVEVDGRDGHASWERMQHDHERDLALRAAGLIVLRYVWRQLRDEAAAVAADLLRAVSSPARWDAPGSR